MEKASLTTFDVRGVFDAVDPNRWLKKGGENSSSGQPDNAVSLAAAILPMEMMLDDLMHSNPGSARLTSRVSRAYADLPGAFDGTRKPRNMQNAVTQAAISLLNQNETDSAKIYFLIISKSSSLSQKIQFDRQGPFDDGVLFIQ
jgi:hypothetical protein